MNISRSPCFVNKGLSSQGYGFSSSHVWMWELDYKESWEPKNWCFWTVVLEKTLENPFDCKETKPVNLKGNQSWIFIGRTNVEAEASILWPPDAKIWVIRKDLDAGKDWRQEEMGMIEDEVVGCHQWLNGHEFEQALGNGEGQGSLACCNPWGHKESDTTELLNSNKNVKTCTHLAHFRGDSVGREESVQQSQGRRPEKALLTRLALGWYVGSQVWRAFSPFNYQGGLLRLNSWHNVVYARHLLSFWESDNPDSASPIFPISWYCFVSFPL